MTINIEKELLVIKKDLKVLSKKVEKMIIAVGRAEIVKPKTAKAKPAKKAAPKASQKKKTVAKKPASKKAKKLTAADTVLNTIKRYKKGVDTARLVKKTGYNQKKIANIVFNLKKQGKIQSAIKGVYSKV